MRNILFLFVSVFALAQNPNHQTFLDHNWRLNFVQDGNNAPVYVASDVNYPLSFMDQNVVFSYTIQVCNWHNFGYNYLTNENVFIKLSSASSLVFCMGPEYPFNHNFFDNFVEQFVGLSNIDSQYSFVLTPMPNDQYGLDIYNPSGKRLNFNTTSLSSEISTLNQTEIYPNPVTDILKISSKNDFKNIVIYQMDGQKVFESESNVSSIDMSKFVAGVYFLKIFGENDVVVIKKIVKN